MNNRLYFSIAALIGMITGYFTVHSFFFHSWTSIFLWVGVGLIVIYLSKALKTAIIGAAVYSFLTISIWLISGFQGTMQQFPGLLLILIIASTLCALAGALGAWIFYLIFRRVKQM